jgi:hypothetical protein
MPPSSAPDPTVTDTSLTPVPMEPQSSSMLGAPIHRVSARDPRPELAYPEEGARRVGWWTALAGLCAILIAPLLVVDVPPLLDYPNHLARIFVLASLAHDPVLARFYAPHWSIIPNLALDLAGPPLMHLLPVHVAGRLLIAISVLLPVLGAIAYSVALCPGATRRWWPFGAGLAAYNVCLLYGFLNFCIAIGVALLLAAAWLRWREERPVTAVALAAAGGPILFACHLMGVIFFGLLVGATELYRLEQMGWRDPRLVRAAIRRGTIVLLAFTAPAVLYALSALRQLGGDAVFVSPAIKLLHLVFTFANYSLPLDLATAAVAVSVPPVALVLGRGRFPGPARNAILLILVAYLAAPYAWKGTYGLDMRFAVMLMFMLFAGFVPHAAPPPLRTTVTAMVTVLFVARMGLLIIAWAAHAEDIADLRRVLAPVQPGQAAYVAAVTPREAPAYWQANPRWRLLSNGIPVDRHLGALVLIERRAWWPFEFDIPSQQPIETRDPYRALAGPVGGLPGRTETVGANLCGFDYVLLTEADAVPDLPPARFRLLARSGFAALYAIIDCKKAA